MEGIVLRSILHAEQDRIVTLMTPAGLIKLFVRGKKRLDLRQQALTTVFTKGDYLYHVRKSDLYRFVDGTVHDQHLPLRDCLEKLSSAQKLVDALLKSQWQNNPSPHLYHLFSLFLKKTCDNPNLVTFFLIKMLKYEGVLQSDDPLVQLIAHTRSFVELENLTIDSAFSKRVEQAFEEATSR